MSKYDPVEIDVTMRQESAKGIGCDVGQKELVWIPKSQIKDYQGFVPDKPTTITIPMWLATNEGLI